MKTFITDDFLLKSTFAQELYHNYAANMPIFDYHNHLTPSQIDQNINFENITQAWLYGDHYKWRAMRTNGVNEHFITGQASDEEKFIKWAETVPHTMRNPLYHWTHLELLRYFDVDILLNGETAAEIYQACNAKMKHADYSTVGLLKQMNVKLVGTTDDPADNLQHHIAFAKQNTGIAMVPTFRPDKAMAIETGGFLSYLDQLGTSANIEIKNFDDLKQSLLNRYAFFKANGGKATDHGLEQAYAEDCSETEANTIFKKALDRQLLTDLEVLKYKSAILLWIGQQNHAHGLVQQFHLGAIRNNNTRLLSSLGPDTGFDSTGDFPQSRALSAFLNKLDSTDQLAKTILYNLNIADNQVFATMIGNFQDGTVPGKMQFGSGWWFLDQKDGMEQQINTLSNMGLLSRFVGMITDSRSFLSFPRHEYFRRILCNLIGEDIKNGEIPADMPWLGSMIQNICFNNAQEYFG